MRVPVTRGYFFLLGALRLVNAGSLRNIDQKKISSGTQGTQPRDYNTNLISFIVRTTHRTRCCSQVIVGQTRRKLNKLRDCLRVFFIFDAILGGGVGEGRAFIREGRLIQTIHLKGGVY